MNTTTQDYGPLKPVEHVELPKYMGTWYVIANIPTMFEKDAYNATETYTWNEKEKRIDVMFRFNQGGPEGKVKEYPQKAFVDNKDTQAEWLVQPLWPFKFSYLILDLAPDYSYAIVGVPNRKHVWILGRAPIMDNNVYRGLEFKLAGMGFDVAKLQKVPQTH